MRVKENFRSLVGQWDGSNKLYLSPDDPVKESDAEASVGLEANEKFFKVNYDWSLDGTNHGGLMLFGFGKDSEITSVWIDSFHQSEDFMKSTGTVAGNKISVKGNYTQPEYADWAWRTDVEYIDEDSFCFTMYNVEPGGTEHVAVEARFNRRK